MKTPDESRLVVKLLIFKISLQLLLVVLFAIMAINSSGRGRGFWWAMMWVDIIILVGYLLSNRSEQH